MNSIPEISIVEGNLQALNSRRIKVKGSPFYNLSNEADNMNFFFQSIKLDAIT